LPHRLPGAREFAASKVTYVKNISPMFEDKCVSCHEPGGIGPMPFTKFEEIAPFAPMIREMIRTQRMPPWRADPSVGHFLGDRSLSARRSRLWFTGSKRVPPRTVQTRWPEDLHGAGVAAGQAGPGARCSRVHHTGERHRDYQRPYIVNPLKEGKWLRASTIKVVNRQNRASILTAYLAEVPDLASGE